MRRMKFVWLAIAVAGLVFGLAACGGDDDDDGGPGETSLDLTIGDSVPLSGALAVFGPGGDKAAQIASSEINDAIKQAGVDHKVTLVTEDNETSPQPAVQAARKMVDADGASCIAGAWASADTIPTFESVTSREGVVQISPASTSNEVATLDDPDGLMNRTVIPDAFQGPTLADLMEQELGKAEGVTVNVGARNDSYGTGLADDFAVAWEDRGGTIGEEVIYDPEQPSYDSEADQITSGNPDAFVIIDFPEPFNKVGAALVRTGNWDPKKAFGTDGLALGAEGAGNEAVEGFRGTTPGSPSGEPEKEEFDALYPEFPPKDVERGPYDSFNFDAVILCYLAAVAAGSTDGLDMAAELRDVSGPPGDKFSWQQLPDAIEALQNGDDIDYVGASGEIDMDEAGDATEDVYDVWRYKDGEVDLEFDEIQATEEPAPVE
jgi:ABC-type branched-subunit amino acid transport system substrate-binding protein